MTVYVIAIVLFLLIIRFVVPIISQSIVDLVNNFQNYYNLTVEKINELPDDSPLKSEYLINLVEEFKNIDLKQFVNVEKLTKYAQGAISIASGIFDFFVSIIVSVYILLERTEIVRFIKKLTKSIFDEDIYNNINKYFDIKNEIFLKYL